MEYWLAYLDQALIFGMFAASLNILLGYSGIFSVASSAFGALGGYLTATLSLYAGWSTGATLVVATAAGAVAGVVLSAPILRLANEYVMLMTMSLSILLLTIITSSPQLGGGQGLVGLPLASLFGIQLFKPSDFVPFLVVSLLVISLICWRIAESPFGRVLRASRDDDLGIRSLGKSPFGKRLFTFALMCAITSFSGAALVLYNGVASVQLFSLNQTLLIFAMVIVGGLSSIPGSIVGAFLIVGVAPFLEQVFQLSPDDSALLRPIVFGIILVIIVRFRPEGIVPERMRGYRNNKSGVERAGSVISSLLGIDRGAGRLGDEDAVLEIKDLSKSFGGVVAVEGLSLKLREGQITALVGANGAGKSTVFNLITGAIRPDSGQVLLNGQNITNLSPQAVAQLGMVRSFQDLRIFHDLTPLENVMLAGHNPRGENPLTLFFTPRAVARRDREIREEARSWLEFVGIDPSLRVRTGSLSFAQQKQVAFARVLATKAHVFLLDEPLSGIEGGAVEEMLRLIERVKATGRTICVVEHSIEAISRLADWAYFMETGKVTAEGTVQDLLNDPRLAEAYFGSIKL
ncbi:branched-chain amino acid transport system permease protein [Arthrobacter sp. GAS37]|uniref:branched-chain amino acid ABC transporter ATP-binding protein/permease n=1 Tax=Arthrobacter sp. GAS37 TaxID=3156261 RepID=UPI0038347D88